jgi:hypothetical protein
VRGIKRDASCGCCLLRRGNPQYTRWRRRQGSSQRTLVPARTHDWHAFRRFAHIWACVSYSGTGPELMIMSHLTKAQAAALLKRIEPMLTYLGRDLVDRIPTRRRLQGKLNHSVNRTEVANRATIRCQDPEGHGDSSDRSRRARSLCFTCEV